MVMLLYFPSRQEQLLKEYEVQELQSLVNATALGVSISLEIEDFQEIRSSIDYLSQMEEILFAAIILNEDGNPSVLTSFPESLSIHDINELQTDAIVKSQILDTSEFNGYVRAAVSNQVIRNKVANINQPIYLIIGIVFLICMIVSYLIAKKYADPLSEVTDFASKLEGGNYAAQIRLNTEIQEVQRLISALESLRKTLIRQRKSEQEFARELENKIKLQTKKLQQALEAKDDFLSTMSHKIQTPLNSIIGFSDILQQRLNSTKNVEMAEAMNNSSKHLLSLVNDILDFSKLSSETVNLKEEAFNLKDLIHNLKSQFAFILNEKGLRLETTLDENISDIVLSDETQISQILNHLLSNSIKFTDKGKIELKITLIKDYESEQRLFFEVKDSGIGISEPDLEKIREPFHQSSSELTKVNVGSGLGLSIVTKLLSLFNSDLKIESKLDQGSIFSFELLLKKGKKQAERLLNEQMLAGGREERKLTVLYVDDMPLNLVIFEEVVSEFNINLDSCTSAFEAYKYCDTRSYDLILMDIRMPEIDGIEAFNHIRKHSKFNTDTPIAAFTANAKKIHTEKYLHLGFCEHISKPIKKDEIRKLFSLIKYAPLEDS